MKANNLDVEIDTLEAALCAAKTAAKLAREMYRKTPSAEVRKLINACEDAELLLNLAMPIQPQKQEE